jgi:hypothetical protein
MPATVTEDPLAYRISLKSPWTAHREFIVTDATDDLAALTDSAIPQADDALSGGSALICQGPVIKEKKGVNYWVIACDYAVSKTGTFVGQNNNPLLLPAVIDWQAGVDGEGTDRSVNGKPLLNAAGDPLQSTNMSFCWTFSVTRYEPWFDFVKAKKFSGTVSAFDLTLGTVTFAAHHLRCDLIAPCASYNINSKYVQMRYSFSCIFGDDRGKYPFDHRLQNAGANGWASKDGVVMKGPFATKLGRVGTVRLDQAGKPLAVEGTQIQVQAVDSGALYDAIANPNTITPDAWESYSGASGVECYFLCYWRHRREDLRVLF